MEPIPIMPMSMSRSVSVIDQLLMLLTENTKLTALLQVNWLSTLIFLFILTQRRQSKAIDGKPNLLPPIISIRKNCATNISAACIKVNVITAIDLQRLNPTKLP